MIELAISVLWLLIGVIILLGIVWLALYVIKLFVPIPDKIEMAIWVIVLILCLIYALSLLSGRGHALRLSLISPAMAQEVEITPHGVEITPGGHRDHRWGGYRSRCDYLRRACMFRHELGEEGQGNCRRYREECE
jgi:uncharacterized protein YhhL (DUF1145 family)